MTSEADPVVAVRHYIEAFNKGDVKAMTALFAVPGSILDGLAPHVWNGPAACEDWYRDAMVAGEHEGAADYLVTLGTRTHADVTGNSAYVAIPATMGFKLHGKQITQSGAMFTVALRKVGDVWLIASWAWTKGTSAAI